MPTTLAIQGFTLAIATATTGPTASLMLELSHPQSDRIAVAQLSANLDGPTYAKPEPACDNCCSDCANRAAVARGRALG
jgi:hypothetical protein